MFCALQGQLISGERLQDHWSSGFFCDSPKMFKEYEKLQILHFINFAAELRSNTALLSC